MSTRERAVLIFDSLTENQLEEFILIFGNKNQVWDNIKEEAPDEFDRKLIEESKKDNDETISFEELIDKLGVNPDDI